MRKLTVPIAALCIGACFLLGLHTPSYSLDSPEAGASTHSIRDRAGRAVALPTTLHKVVVTCYGGASHEIAILGGADKIIGQPTMHRFPLFLKMYPEFVQVPDPGSFDNVSLEQILALKPDVVFAPIISARANQRMEELGIPVVIVAVGRADIPGILDEFQMVGTILGSGERAEQLVEYWKDKLTLIRERTASIPEDKKKRVLYTSSPLPYRTEGGTWWSHHFIAGCGAINVAQKLTQAGEVTIEQILAWNPDVIIVTKNNLNPTTVEAITDNPQLRTLKAVRDHQVHQCPIGAFWWDRPSPEAILGFLWLTKILYPDRMMDINLEAEARLFFKTFYNYELSATECEQILKGP